MGSKVDFLAGAITRPSRATLSYQERGTESYDRERGSIPQERRSDAWTAQHEARIAAHARRVLRDAPPHERPGNEMGRPKQFSQEQLAAMRAEYAALPRHQRSQMVVQGVLGPFRRRWGVSNQWIASHLRNAA